MYSILVTLALCLAASARPALKNRQFLGHSIAGVATGIPCTNDNPAGCFNGDITKCVNGEFIVSQPCTDPQTCLFLPVNGTVAPACSTTQEQTDLFAQAFGGIDNIPTD